MKLFKPEKHQGVVDPNLEDFWLEVEAAENKKKQEILGAVAIFSAEFEKILPPEKRGSKTLELDEQGSRITFYRHEYQLGVVICNMVSNERTTVEIANSGSGLGQYVMSLVSRSSSHEETRVVQLEFDNEPVKLHSYSDSQAKLPNSIQSEHPAEPIYEVINLVHSLKPKAEQTNQPAA
ncbi:hypothetical protein KBC51_00080 [Candidatus Saccharibacteria bacterium]|nr:hypothetical protein [Candidatus Saccharibacteria bacterium]